MLFSLVKKDFLIIKKYVGLMLIVSFLIPPFLLLRVPEEAAGSIGFIFTIIFGLFMLTQQAALKEYQCPKATTLLCAAPYPRKLVVLSKYCFCLIIYAACCLIFLIDTFIFPKLGTFNVKMAVVTFLAVTIFLSVYFPVHYKLGYEKTKFAFAIAIVISPYLSAYLLRPENAAKIDFLAAVPTTAIIIGGIMISLAILLVSLVLSVKIFEKSDLT